ncbi:MAG: helix-turn-helix domain-containing protein [Steroidobacteraceae bacterium]|jgi:putative transcriptional regulator
MAKSKSSRAAASSPWSIRVAKMRGAMGLSQQAFAALIGVSLATLRSWELGRRRPSGPAVVLLSVLVAEPEAVLRALR